MAQKPGKGDDATFLIAFFGVHNCRTSKQMTFFGDSWDKAGQHRYVLKINFWVSKIDFFYMNLTWPWVKYKNKCHHRILPSKWPIRHVSYDTRAIFSCVDLIWPGLDLDLYLAWASYLHDIFVFPSVAFWRGLGLQLSLVWSWQPIRAIRFSFDIWPDLDQTFDLLRKF